MPSALIDNMIQQYHYPVLDEAAHNAFIQQHEECVLFFTEDPVRFPESNDVAMILPELVREYAGRFQAAVIDQSAQRSLQTRYGFTEWPSLVFLRNAQYLGVVSRVQDWVMYLTQINQILESQPRKAPGFVIPVEQAAAACSHS